jgi:hypothetical protein
MIPRTLHASALQAVDGAVWAALRFRTALAWVGAGLLVASVATPMLLCPAEAPTEPSGPPAALPEEPVAVVVPEHPLSRRSLAGERIVEVRSWTAAPAMPALAADPLCAHASSTLRRAAAVLDARDARCPARREMLSRFEEALRVDVGARGGVQVSVAIPF